MNPEIKKLWVEALRSGEYPQTIECLQDNTGFCCLGVLCDLYMREHHPDKTWRDHSDFHGVIPLTPADMEEPEMLPDIVKAWAGISSKNGMLPGEFKERNTLVSLNDGGCGFEYIANIIEKEL